MLPKNVKEIIHALDKTWNSRDLEKILEFYSDDFELTSPMIKLRLEIEDGTLRGKENVRVWWTRVLTKVPDLSSELISVSEGVDSVCYIFKSSATQSIGSSFYYFDENGKIKKEIYHC